MPRKKISIPRKKVKHPQTKVKHPQKKVKHRTATIVNMLGIVGIWSYWVVTLGMHIMKHTGRR